MNNMIEPQVLDLLTLLGEGVSPDALLWWLDLWELDNPLPFPQEDES